MIRDRGKIKWTSLMLPEHVKMLRDWQEEEKYKTKPQLDEQQLEEMNETICCAMETGEPLAITHYVNRDFEVVVGRIHYYDDIQKQLRIIDHFDGIHYVRMQHIIDVRPL
jgi:hypothetical protein